MTTANVAMIARSYVQSRDELHSYVDRYVRPTVRKAINDGVPISELARLFGTSRTSIRRWADEQ